MSRWQELENEVATLRADHERLSTENPKLDEKNTLLKKEVEHHTQMVIDAQSTLEQINADARTLKADADKYVAKVTAEVDELKSNTVETQAMIDARNDARATMLDAREADLNKREAECIETEKSNVAQSTAIDESAKLLEAQAQEIIDATKVLNTKAVDNQHEEQALQMKSDDLDSRERSLIARETAMLERDKVSYARSKRANELYADARDKLIRVDARISELDIRENFIVTRESAANKREKQLDDRTRVLESSRG